MPDVALCISKDEAVFVFYVTGLTGYLMVFLAGQHQDVDANELVLPGIIGKKTDSIGGAEIAALKFHMHERNLTADFKTHWDAPAE
jgi:hypothetical protein